jgi:regulator of chromosome condensation
MPPKRAAAAASDAAPSAKKTRTASATKKTAAASKAEAPKKAAPAKKAAAAKKTAPAEKKPVAKKVTASKKASAAKKSSKTAEESDKENQDAAPKVNGVKRRRDDEEADAAVSDDQTRTKRAKKDEAPAAPPKKRKVAAPKPAAKRVPRELKPINEAPTQVMDIFVFGEGSAGELGLGSVRVDGKKPIDVKRPRLNHNLKGVVQVACGGMHVAALTKDNKILTWGVNDQGALGRDTTWSGGLRDVDDENDSDSDEEDTGMNPKESTPAEIDTSDVPDDVKWVQVVASDSATFALTTTGQVWGWGTFRVSLPSTSLFLTCTC